MNDQRRLLLASMGLGLGLAAATANAASGAGARTAASAETSASLTPDTGRDMTAALQRAIDAAATARRPLLLPPGRFLVSTLRLRPGTRLSGSGPATRLEHLGGGPALLAEGADDVCIARLALAGRSPQTRGHGLVEAIGSRRLTIDDIAVTDATANAIYLERSSGRLTGCTLSGIARAALWSMDAAGLDISHNTISDCGDNGILVWRSEAGEDGTIVSANRIERIAATSGGTGQNGNGINVYRAGNVVVSGNRITDCAYSAIRANAASNVQIVSNSTSRSGEVALYAEFAFEGAVISSNIVDGAATGISVTNFSEGGRLAVVHGNVVRNLVQRAAPDVCGDGISVEADAAVTGNVVEGAPSTGLVLGFGPWGRDIVATGNVLRRCTIGIGVSASDRAGPMLIANNMISGTRDGAIRQLDHGRPVGPDILSNPAGGRISSTGNVVS